MDVSIAVFPVHGKIEIINVRRYLQP